MNTSAAGRAAISAREGCILTAYKDSAGVLTIGVGHTTAAGLPAVTAGMKTKMVGVTGIEPVTPTMSTPSQRANNNGDR